jgi:hypothetical protein
MVTFMVTFMVAFIVAFDGGLRWWLPRWSVSIRTTVTNAQLRQFCR